MVFRLLKNNLIVYLTAGSETKNRIKNAYIF